MKTKILIVLGAALAALSLTAIAVADSPHYITGPTATVGDNSLTVTFKAVGLGNTVSSADFTLTGTANVTAQCYTKAGNPVNGVPKSETVDVNAGGSFTVRNGSVTGSIKVSPLSTLTCTGNQHVEATVLSYNLTLSGTGLPDVQITG